MANTITNLIPDAYEALDIVSREMTGFISAVSTDNSAERVELNGTVRIPVTQAQAAADNTPAQEVPDTGDQTIDNVTMTIDNSKHVPIRWNGEQTRGYKRNGLFSNTRAEQIAQGMRTLVNLIEADIAGEYIRASRAYGTAGTTPFSSDLSDLANMKKILTNNGAPLGDRQCVINSAAMVNLLGLTNLTQVNAAGSDETLRAGEVSRLFGFNIYESAQIQDHTKGTATGFDANGGEPVGETTIVVDGSDSGTILAGDVVTWAGDTNKYIVVSSTASGAATGNIVIAKPGLREALADTVEGTIGANYTANMCFSRSAIQLATRTPAMPDGGDKAIDMQTITDDRTGISFELVLYPGFRRNVLHVAIAWGTKLIKPEHTAILLG